MKRYLAILIALLALFAVIVQFQLMTANRATPITETTIRFFSYFTILTNLLVAIYFVRVTYQNQKAKEIFHINFSTLTAVTVYITIVGLVYQILLRQAWSPTGMQKIVDEILHSANPLFVICFWFLNVKGNLLHYRRIPTWLIYPLIYLFYVMIRGHFSNFYPYPFIDVSELGRSQVFVNSFGMTLLFIIVSTIFVWLNRNINTELNKKTSR